MLFISSLVRPGIKYVGNCATKLRARFNNYNNRHKSTTDFEFTLIDQGENLECTLKRERFWLPSPFAVVF